MLMAGLIVLALVLTATMFATQQMMLGFPSAIFWALLGGQSYLQSTIPWGDIYFYIYFASFGMAIFCMFAAYALRTKKEEADEGDLFFDEGGDKDVKFIDEGGSPSDARERYDEYGDPYRKTKPEPKEKLSLQRRGIRDRAEARRKHFES